MQIKEEVINRPQRSLLECSKPKPQDLVVVMEGGRWCFEVGLEGNSRAAGANNTSLDSHVALTLRRMKIFHCRELKHCAK